MTTEREWLIEQGLAKPGRGRLSHSAHEALATARANGVLFTDRKPIKRERNDIVRDEDGFVIFKPSIKMRNLKGQLFGYTIEGWKVGFVACRRCSQYMNYCECPEGIKPPGIVVSLDARTEKAVEYPHGK